MFQKLINRINPFVKRGDKNLPSSLGVFIGSILIFFGLPEEDAMKIGDMLYSGIGLIITAVSFWLSLRHPVTEEDEELLNKKKAA